MTIETFRPGNERRFVRSMGNTVTVDIRHRITADGVKPELWSMWSWWGRFDSEEDARAAHNGAIGKEPTK